MYTIFGLEEVEVSFMKSFLKKYVAWTCNFDIQIPSIVIHKSKLSVFHHNIYYKMYIVVCVKL